MSKMSYEEWRSKLGPMEVTDELQKEFYELHGIDARKEVEVALQKEYNYLFNGKEWDAPLELNDERIRELAEQAGYELDMFGVGHWDMPECKKFVELIILECVKVCSIRAGNSDYNTGRMHCASDIAEYFGMRTPGKYKPKMPELNDD